MLFRSVEPKVSAKPKVAKKYDANELILCRSIYEGTLLFTGIKTKMTYEFSASGDVQYVEYQDLLAAMLLKRKSLTAPYIIIEDDELIDSVHWKSIKDTYDAMYEAGDMEDLINLPVAQFEEAFVRLPIGYKNVVKSIISDRVLDGRSEERRVGKEC